MRAPIRWGRRGGLAKDTDRLRVDITRAQQRLGGLVALSSQVQGQHATMTMAALDQNLAGLRALSARWYPIEQRGWEDPAWVHWSPPAARSSADPGPVPITVGQLREVRTGALLGVPALVPWAGSGRPIIVRSRGAQRGAAVALLQSMVVRTLLLTGPARTTLVDPGGRGASFPLAACLLDADPSHGDLDHLIADLARTFTDAPVGTSPEERWAGAEHHVVAVADFPAGYDRRTLASLRSIIRSVPPPGVHLLIHHALDAEVADDHAELADGVVVDMANRPAPVIAGHGASGVEVDVVFDPSPPAALARDILTLVADAPRVDRTLRWDDLGHPTSGQWWQGQATDRIKAPIGRQGSGQALDVYFGVDGPDARACAHGVVVAMTGAGKTALFHTLIASLTVRYGPEELQLYLLDGKCGVGFAGYRGLPHAAVLSLRTRPAVARSVLDDLLDEMLRRHEVFKRHGVEHFAAHRAAGSPEGRLPRILLIADEFQLLFEDDRDGRAAADLLRLSEQSRSAGIHLLLGSQHFAPAAMTHRNLIFANLHLRMALQMATAEVRACSDFGPEGRHLMAATCTRSGRVVVNDRAGDDAANRAGSVAYIDDRRRATLVSALARRRGGTVHQIVLDGEHQPDLGTNPLLGRMAETSERGGADAIGRLARRARRDGGLGCEDWIAAERPVAVVLGQTFSVRDHAVAVLRRRPHEHLCVIGESHSERIATLAAALTGACLQVPSGDLSIRIVDRSLSSTPWSLAIRELAARVRSAGYEVDLVDDDDGAQRVITDVAVEVDGRRGPTDPGHPFRGGSTVVVVLVDADRVAPLARIPDVYGLEESELGSKLGSVLDHGAPVGVHVLAGFTTLGAARTVMADRRLQSGFRHRVAMQMSDDDSFTVVGSPAASRLQGEGPRPVAAVLFDRQANQPQLFKPFTLRRPADDAPSFAAQVDGLLARLSPRPERVAR